MRFPLCFFAFLIVFGATGAVAAGMSCRVDGNTDKHWCYRPSEVRSNGTARAFKIYQGGEKNITNVGGFEGRVSCADNVVMELRDRDGVVFARDALSPATAMWDLRKDICAEKRPKADPKIKPF